ncbi:8731_t:CDS:10 [Funneliformis geosporum]|uniref:7848_t:CDS:1 n=1 Tax=Funneliformis geosporum TaxID=1117311 RepID=A0A9W4WKM7_9GLOM|nr:8731_t:CDS:10 [Funneliformis geosporum]CAI2169088.1 7848_t:CDS:10 [Funneliformis geosporum]
MAPSIAEFDNTNGVFSELPPGFVISNDGLHMVFDKEIEKSNNDDRSYRIIRLTNQLEVLIIHDSNTDKAAASMDINVGSYSDMDNLLGLAHFCEHLLFMGTTKYPKENDYSEFLDKHNGSCNAYTCNENTNYYFEVGHEYLEPALDRFAQFFISPLFDADCTDRELKAVDSEFKEYLQNDDWRISQLQKLHSNPKHPWSRFSVGNLETLKESPTKEGIDIREELIKWYEKHYSANLMKLCILGSDPLDKLTEWVVEKFSDIQNKNFESLKPVEIPLRKEEDLCKQILAKPVKDIHALDINIPIPNQIENYKAKAAEYASHLIGHEGVGSISSLLKKKGWITNIYAGPIEFSVDFHIMEISVDLTEDGLDVVEIIFLYVEMLRREGPQEWFYKEIRNLSDIKWRYMEKSCESSYTCSLSETLHKPYTRDRILSSPFKDFEYNPKLIVEILNCLRIEYSIINLSSKLLSDLDQKERWFNVEYKYTPINEELIKVSDFYRVWYKKDDKWWVPKAKLDLYFKTPLINLTLSNLVKTKLYLDLFNDAFAEEAYDALLAEIYYSAHVTSDGTIHVNVSGYNDKSLELMELVLKRMKDFEIRPERFKVLKERLMRNYNNTKLYQPSSLTEEYYRQLFKENYYSGEEKSAILKDISMEDVQSFFPELFKQLFIESYVLEKYRMVKNRNVRLPQGKKYVYQANVFDKDEFNNAIGYYLQCGDNTDIYVVTRLKIISQILHEPVFDHLRTKEQLGYSVYSHVNSSIGEIGLLINLQSEKNSTYLENRVEAFLIKTQKIIEEMSEDEYQKQKQSLIDSLLEKDKNMWDEAYKYSKQISCGYCDFYEDINIVKEIKTVTKDDILEFYKIHIHPKSSHIKKLSVHVNSLICTNNNINDATNDYNNYENLSDDAKENAEENDENDEINEEIEENYILSEDNILITDIIDFKNRMCFGPSSFPIMPLSTFYAEEMLNQQKV